MALGICQPEARTSVCESGVVPRCYGWLELSRKHLELISALPNISIEAQNIKFQEKPVVAIAMEYIGGGEKLSIKNISSVLERIE